MSEYLLEMKGIHKSFAGVHALDDVDFAIRPGKVMCLLGENGCGKSTLVKIISGVYIRDAGEVIYDGEIITKITPVEATKRGIQVIYQDLSIFPNLTVRENLSINTEIAANRFFANRKRMDKIAREALDKIGYEVDLDAKMGDLSVADKQLIAICRALLHNARLIIMDEPTTALTRKEVEALFSTVRQLKENGISIMFIGHKIEEIFEIADDVAIMRNGKNVYLGAIDDVTAKDIAYYMTGRELSDEHFVPQNISDSPILEVRNLSSEGNYHNIDFKLHRGEILGITGLLGSGRTELAMSMFGLLKPEKGEMILNGSKVSITSPIVAQNLRIGYVPEDRLTEGLCLLQPIADNITLPSLKQLSKFLGFIKQKDVLGEANKWVENLSIVTDDANKFVSTLSGGNQQKVVLSKWLNTELDILILNGPTVGVDVGAKQDIHHLIRELANDGLGVIIISDDLTEVISNCNRVIVMKDGQIVGKMEEDEITHQAILDIIR